jgi:phage head maturation protease
MRRDDRVENAAVRLVFARVDPVADDRSLAERLGRLQPVQTLDQHETRTVRPHQDWRLLPIFENARGNFIDAPLLQRSASFDWHVNVCDGENFALHRALE